MKLTFEPASKGNELVGMMKWDIYQESADPDSDTLVGSVFDEEAAQQLVHRFNLHEELVEALEGTSEILDRIATHFFSPGEGPYEDYKREMEAAEKVLAKAKSQ